MIYKLYLLVIVVHELVITVLQVLYNNEFSVPAKTKRWPAHLALPMILMRENFKKSFDVTVTRSKSIVRPGGFECPDCGRVYKLKSSLRNHQKWECGKEPQFKCPYCVYKAKQKMHMARHMERMHREIDYSAIKDRTLILESRDSD